MRRLFPFVEFAVFWTLFLAGCGAKQTEPLDQQIDAVFRSAHENGKFNGSVLVTRKDQTLYEKSFGLADLEKGRPNTTDTGFIAFSILKPMTAVLIF